MKDHDPVNYPSHYTRGGIETIDAIEAWGLDYHLGNAVKYISRAGHKDNELQDLKKARWYLDRAIEKREGKKEESQPEKPKDPRKPGWHKRTLQDALARRKLPVDCVENFWNGLPDYEEYQSGYWSKQVQQDYYEEVK